MRCVVCQGSGKQTVVIAERENGEPYIIGRLPCKHCNGSGHSYCCDDAGAGIAEGGVSSPEPKFSRCFECGLEPYECRCPTPGRAQPEDAP